MARYLISFDTGAMTFPEDEWADIAEAAHAVVRQAMDAGVWVFGGGLYPPEELSVVSTDGSVADGPHPDGRATIGGFSVVDVPSREQALSGRPGSPSRAAVPRMSASSSPTRSWVTEALR